MSKVQRAARCSALIIFLCVILAGCSRPEIETCSIYLGKDVLLDEYGFPSIVNGSHTVFEYYHEVPEPPCTFDAGMKEILVFQIAPEVSEFTVADADLFGSVATYRYEAFSPYNGAHPVSSGTIAGTHVYGRAWDVAIDVLIRLKALDGDLSTETRELHLRREFQVRH